MTSQFLLFSQYTESNEGNLFYNHLQTVKQLLCYKNPFGFVTCLATSLWTSLIRPPYEWPTFFTLLATETEIQSTVMYYVLRCYCLFLLPLVPTFVCPLTTYVCQPFPPETVANIFLFRSFKCLFRAMKFNFELLPSTATCLSCRSGNRPATGFAQRHLSYRY